MSKDWTPGTYVFAKLKSTSKMWPAIVVSATDAYMPELLNDKTVYVFWFGDHRISEVKKEFLIDFNPDAFNTDKDKRLLKKWTAGFQEAAQEFEKLKRKHSHNSIGVESNIMEGERSASNVPEKVNERLKKRSLIAWKPYNTTKNTDICKKMCLAERLLKTCMACFSTKPIRAHPIFQGKLCLDCHTKLKHTTNVFSKEGCYKYCVICGNFGNMLMCTTSSCKRQYCFGCVRKLEIGFNGQQETWKCMFCKNIAEFSTQSDWKYKLQIFFMDNIDIREIKRINLKSVNIVSTFYGRSKGLGKLLPYTNVSFLNNDFLLGFDELSNLNFDMHVNIIKFKHRDLQTDQCDKLCILSKCKSLIEFEITDINEFNFDVHLTIGGTSKNAVEVYEVEPSGILFFFFEFYRIYRILPKTKYWMFELSTTVSQYTISVISSFMGCKPFLLLVTEKNERDYHLIWTNLPSI